MATVYRCDRCLAIFNTNTLTDVVVPGTPAFMAQSSKIVENVEQQTVGLCLDCLNDLRHFIAGNALDAIAK